MAKQVFKRVFRRATPEERARHAGVRREVMKEFPPVGAKAAPPGIPNRIRTAREARGLTWYALAKLAGIPNSSTVRDIENGRDAQMSNVQAIAQVLGLRLELVEKGV